MDPRELLLKRHRKDQRLVQLALASELEQRAWGLRQTDQLLAARAWVRLAQASEPERQVPHQMDPLLRERQALVPRQMDPQASAWGQLASEPEPLEHHQMDPQQDQPVLQARRGQEPLAEEFRFQRRHPRHQTGQLPVVRRRDRWPAVLPLALRVRPELASCRQRRDFAAPLVRCASSLQSGHRFVCSYCHERASEHFAESFPATCGQDLARALANGRWDRCPQLALPRQSLFQNPLSLLLVGPAC